MNASFQSTGDHSSDQEPLVSVVIPAYNAASYIARTLQSVIEQTHRELEIIVVDDGSTDETLAIARSYAACDDRLKIISQANGGVARARNVGIEAARADFVAFIDADDLWHPTKIACQVMALSGPVGRIYGASYALHRIIDEEDRVLRSSGTSIRSGSILVRHLTGRFVGNGSTLMARRSAVIAVGGFDPSYADAGIGGCEDLDIELKLAAKYRIVGTPAYLVGYRVYPGNMSSNFPRMARSIVATIHRHLAANGDVPEIGRRYALASTYAWTARILLSRGEFKRSLAAMVNIFRADVGEGIILLRDLSGSAWRKVGKALHLLKGRRSPASSALAATASGSATLPLFSSLSPVDGIDVPEGDRRIRRLARLEPFDLQRDGALVVGDDSVAIDADAAELQDR